MTRKSGWYWVKVTRESSCALRYYSSKCKKWTTSLGDLVKDDYFYKIYPERIKSPEEK